MPRTRLDRFSETPEKYRENFKRTVRSAMWRKGISTQKALAIDMGLTADQIKQRFKTGFKDYELKRLNQILEFTEKERQQLWGC